MTASTLPRVDVRIGGRTEASPFLGFGAFFRKEVVEWVRGRRALVLLVATGAMMGLMVLGSRLAVLSAAAGGITLPALPSLDPTHNVLAKWDQWVFVYAISASASLLVGERDRGTLAWSLSKPLSRSALLLAKWAAGVLMFSVFAIALPMAICVVVAVPAYGMPDLAAVAVATVLLTTVPAFFIGLALVLGIVLPGQAGVGGASLGVALSPYIVGSVAPGVAAMLPPSIGSWAMAVAAGGPAPLATPLGWLAGMVLVGIAGLWAIERADL